MPTDDLLALLKERHIKRADVALLLALMSYKRQPDTTKVWPHQTTLAAALDCSVRTVQYGLDRLANAGLIFREYRQTENGLLLGRCYDLAPLYTVLPPDDPSAPGDEPRKAADRPAGKVADRSEDPPDDDPPDAPSQTGPETPKSPIRKFSRSESESEFVAEIDNSARVHGGARAHKAPPSVVGDSHSLSEEELPPVAEKLAQAGILRRFAARLCAEHGEARCAEVLAAALKRRRIKTVPGWIVRCLDEKWDVTRRPAAPPLRPRAHHAYVPPPAPAPSAAPDALAALSPEALTALEDAARARLITRLPALRSLLERGRRTPLVRHEMRLLLAAPRDLSEPTWLGPHGKLRRAPCKKISLWRTLAIRPLIHRGACWVSAESSGYAPRRMSQ